MFPPWVESVRSVLELLYFAAGIAIAIAAFMAIKQVRIGSEQLRLASEQLTLTKELEEKSNRREAAKLAAQQCKYFADELVPAWTGLTEKANRLGNTFLNVYGNNPPFVLKDGEFVHTNFDSKLIGEGMQKIGLEVVAFLNKAESFAIPFAAGVATDEIGFEETAAAFCTQIRVAMPAVFFLMQTQGVGYKSVRKLYSLWNDRAAAKAMAPALKPIQEFVEAAAKKTITPM